MKFGASGISDADALSNGWIITTDPSSGAKIYLDAATGSYMNADTGSQGTASSDGIGGTIAAALAAGVSIAQLNAQQRAFNTANQSRISQGLTPLPWSSFAPTASLGLTASPQVLMVAIGVAAILGIAVFSHGRGRRR